MAHVSIGTSFVQKINIIEMYTKYKYRFKNHFCCSNIIPDSRISERIIIMFVNLINGSMIPVLLYSYALTLRIATTCTLIGGRREQFYFLLAMAIHGVRSGNNSAARRRQSPPQEQLNIFSLPSLHHLLETFFVAHSPVLKHPEENET